MFGPTQAQSRTETSMPRTGGTPKKSFSKASTADIRALLSELKTLPDNQRKLLCKLLKRAAATAPRKVSVVRLAVSHQTKKL